MITDVAIKYQGNTYSLPKPKRHHHVILVIARALKQSVGPNEQGFLDENGRFYTRAEALRHALGCNQITDRDAIRAGKLFSEDIW